MLLLFLKSFLLYALLCASDARRAPWDRQESPDVTFGPFLRFSPTRGYPMYQPPPLLKRQCKKKCRTHEGLLDAESEYISVKSKRIACSVFISSREFVTKVRTFVKMTLLKYSKSNTFDGKGMDVRVGFVVLLSSLVVVFLRFNKLMRCTIF